MKIIQNRKYYYIFSGILILISILSIGVWRLKPGIDFSGGSLLEVKFDHMRPDSTAITQALTDLDLGDIKVQPAGEKNVILRFKDVDENTHQDILSKLKDEFTSKDKKNDDGLVVTSKDKTNSQETTFVVVSGPVLEELRFESIGPIIGQEIKHRAWIAITLAVLAIVAYIAYVFRRVSKPVSSWKYGVSAILALAHDLLIVTGLFSVLGHFYGTEVNALFITALLTILGFSVNDTIVVFDRTRENLGKHYTGDFEEVVNDSVNQTISRSINTSLTTLIILLALYFLGGKTISDFVLALIAGVIVGTYSSIFVASPLMVSWYNISKLKKQ